MIIYGAGLAGLLAANMLRRHSPIICEAQPSLPNNHKALLRFRSSAVSDATGIPFRKVRVLKAIFYNGMHFTTPNLFFGNLYAQKVTGSVIGRSIMNLDPVDRYIAPDNLIELLAKDLQIRYGWPLGIGEIAERANGKSAPAISTVPLPVMMNFITQEGADKISSQGPLTFDYKPIWSVVGDILGKVDVYQTLYYPGGQPYYRASITGRHVIIEFSSPPGGEPEGEGMTSEERVDLEGECFRVLKEVVNRHFGIKASSFSGIQIKAQKYGKILPVEDDPRKRAIMHLTDKYNLYSVGRFATWRQLLMDDVVSDVKTVERFITSRDSYARALHYPTRSC